MPENPGMASAREYDAEGRALCFICGRPQSAHEGGVECSMASAFGSRKGEEEALDALEELEGNRETICEHAGHEWEDMGGGVDICVVCTLERWAPDA